MVDALHDSLLDGALDDISSTFAPDSAVDAKQLKEVAMLQAEHEQAEPDEKIARSFRQLFATFGKTRVKTTWTAVFGGKHGRSYSQGL